MDFWAIPGPGFRAETSTYLDPTVGRMMLQNLRTDEPKGLFLNEISGYSRSQGNVIGWAIILFGWVRFVGLSRTA